MNLFKSCHISFIKNKLKKLSVAQDIFFWINFMLGLYAWALTKFSMLLHILFTLNEIKHLNIMNSIRFLLMDLQLDMIFILNQTLIRPSCQLKWEPLAYKDEKYRLPQDNFLLYISKVIWKVQTTEIWNCLLNIWKTNSVKL